MNQSAYNSLCFSKKLPNWMHTCAFVRKTPDHNYNSCCVYYTDLYHNVCSLNRAATVCCCCYSIQKNIHFPCTVVVHNVKESIQNNCRWGCINYRWTLICFEIKCIFFKFLCISHLSCTLISFTEFNNGKWVLFFRCCRHLRRCCCCNNCLIYGKNDTPTPPSPYA